MKFKRKGEPVDVPGLGLVGVADGDVVDAPAAIAASFKSQPDAWEPVPSTTKEK